jgi:hypothetical protein
MQPKPPPRGPLAGPSYQPPSSPPVPLPQPNRQGSSEMGLQSSNQYLRTPVIRYSSRMRLNKLHPLKVSLTGVNGEVEALRPQSQSGGFDPPVVVQVSVPGAIVTPPHVIIPVSGGEAQFVVQPIMTGRLTGARVEFLSQGRKVSEVQLPMKVNRGYLAKFFLFLALLLPILIHFLPELNYVNKTPNRKPVANNPGPGAAPVRGVTAPVKRAPEQPGKKTSMLDVIGSTMILLQDTPAKNEKSDVKKTDGAKADETKAGSSSSAPNKSQGESSGGGNRGLSLSVPVAPPNLDPSGTTTGASYTGEDAIWAWTRAKLEREGYRTELVPSRDLSAMEQLFTFDKKYEIVKESNSEWSTTRVAAIVMHYAESTLRMLYRVFIVFPKSWPFGDLIYSLVFLALAAIFWMYTGPNRRKVKGPTMDIRFAAA